MVEIKRDSLLKIAYSTDASAYREIPFGVAFPKSENEVVELVKSSDIFLIPRAGGTSIAGQVVGSGVVVDISRFMNRILEINAEEHWARVQPGVVLDELNRACEGVGLFFGPETSTSNRCCLGGMFGNNSCGSHSLVYGSTRDHILEARVVLGDGSVEVVREVSVEELETRFGKEFWIKGGEESGRSEGSEVSERSEGRDRRERGEGSETSGVFAGKVGLLERIYSQLIGFAIDERVASLIEERYPDKVLRRRNCGYAIDEVIAGLVDSSVPFGKRTINLCKLLAGSEGTLAFVTEIKVNLVPLPPKESMVLCVHCDSLKKSFLANLVALKFSPVAVELMDSNILELSKGNVEQLKNRFFVEGDPAAILIVELRGESRECIDKTADDLANELVGKSGLAYCCTRVYGSDIARVWSLRKSGLGLLSGMKGDTKPVSVIEDTAVAPERLPAYMEDFGSMLNRLGLSCVYHAHIGTGELHLRPILDVKSPGGHALFRKVAYETALLVKKYRGSLSGEHGDGRLRGEFIGLLYGDEVFSLMKEVKRCWDPRRVFNLHKIVDTAPMDCFLRYDVGQKYEIFKELKGGDTYFNWKAAFDECSVAGATGAASQLHALMCSIEQCNGAGDCRKSNLMGGTLCPVFKVSQDEVMSTRARANVLREVLTRGLSSEAFSFDSVAEVGKVDKVYMKELSDEQSDWQDNECINRYTNTNTITNNNIPNNNIPNNKNSTNGSGSLFEIPELYEVLSSCLACKGCRSECPSNVDMTRLRAEILQHHYDVCGTPTRVFLVARMAVIERLGHYVWPVYNFFASCKLTSTVIKRLIRFASERNIPTLSRFSMRHLVAIENRGFLNAAAAAAASAAAPAASASVAPAAAAPVQASVAQVSASAAPAAAPAASAAAALRTSSSIVSSTSVTATPSASAPAASQAASAPAASPAASASVAPVPASVAQVSASAAPAAAAPVPASASAAAAADPGLNGISCTPGTSSACDPQSGSSTLSFNGRRGKVYLFADEFTNYQEAELGLRFVKLLHKLGYSVEIPRHVESGRAAISKGCLKLAKKFAVKNVGLLKDIVSEEFPLVGIEPSCILSFRDEYPDLVPNNMRASAKVLAGNCLLFDEFIMREVAAGRISSADFTDSRAEVWLHGHCHQKALVGIEKTAAILKLPVNYNVHVIPSGCCGMAGSFGYEKEHYKTSIAIGEMVLFPAVRRAVEAVHVAPLFVVAPGTSCRQQIFDGTGVRALHPVDLLYISLRKEL